MLAGYDAEAVAEVMGIGFLQGPETSVPPPGTRTQGVPVAGGKREGDFIFTIGGHPVMVVETKASDRLAPSGKQGIAGSAFGDARNSLVAPPSSVLIEKAVERGLPREALRHVAEWLAGGDKARVSSLEWELVPRTTLDRRETQLSPQESERTERVARLSVHAHRALGTQAEARAFMTSAHPMLDGRSPIDSAKSDLGTRRTEQILNAIEYGLAL